MPKPTIPQPNNKQKTAQTQKARNPSNKMGVELDQPTNMQVEDFHVYICMLASIKYCMVLNQCSRGYLHV